MSPANEHPALQPVSRGETGHAIPEEDLDGLPSARNLADLCKKMKRHHLKDQEPIWMMKGPPKFNTIESGTLNEEEMGRGE